MTTTAVLGDPGSLIINTDVDDVVIAALKTWLPTALRLTAEERDVTVPVSPNGAAYNNPLDVTEWGDGGFPGIMVATSETVGKIVRQRNEQYTTAWNVVVSAVVKGPQGHTTRRRAGLYEGAVRRALGWKNVWGADSIVSSAYWQGAKTRPVTTVSRAGRYLVAGMSTFLVVTDAAFSDSPGLSSPDPVDGPPQPYVTAVTQPFDVIVGGLPPDQDLGG